MKQEQTQAVEAAKELLPCPFCGREAEMLGPETFVDPWSRVVECRYCGVRMGAYISDTAENNELKARNNWNARVEDEAAIQSAVDAALALFVARFDAGRDHSPDDDKILCEASVVKHGAKVLRSEGYERLGNRLDSALQILLAAVRPSSWVEGLPSDVRGQWWLCTTDLEDGLELLTWPLFGKDGKWFYHDESDLEYAGKVIAYRPLPEPYQISGPGESK